MPLGLVGGVGHDARFADRSSAWEQVGDFMFDTVCRGEVYDRWICTGSTCEQATGAPFNGARRGMMPAKIDVSSLSFPPDSVAKDDCSTPRTLTTLPEGGTPRSYGTDETTDHALGRCKPCLFALTSAGCDNGDACTFCHLKHSRRNCKRPCKGKRLRYRKLVERRLEEVVGQPDIGSTACQDGEDMP